MANPVKAERRQTDAGGKLKTKIITAVVILTALIMAVAVFCFVFCKVNVIKVEGKINYTADEVINSVSLIKGQSMFTLDTEEIANTVETALPYTDNVKVIKKYPRTVKIIASPAAETYAVMLSENFYAITTGELKVLKAQNSAPENLIIVQGGSIATYELGKPLSFSGDGDEKGKEILISLNDAIKECGIENVNMINIYDINNLYFIYDNRIVVKLGTAENLSKKISLGKKTLDEENKQSAFQYGELDLSITKEAIFAPVDLKDLQELLDYLSIEQQSEEAEETDESDEGETSAETDDVVSAAESDESTQEAAASESETTELILHAD